MDVQSLVISLGLDSTQFRTALGQVQNSLVTAERRLQGVAIGAQQGLRQLAPAGRAGASSAGASMASLGAGVEAVRTKCLQADRIMRQMGNRFGNVVRGTMARFIAPLMGALAIGGVVSSYFSGIAQAAQQQGAWSTQAEEWHKKRAALARVNKEDIELYRKGKEALLKFNIAMGDLSATVMRALSPVVRWAIEKLDTLSDWVKRNEPNIVRFIKIVAGVIGAALIPVLAKLALVLLANPITWIIAALILLTLVIDDLITYINGGDSALEAFWSQFGTGEEIAESLMEVWRELKDVWQAVCEFFAPMFEKAWGRLKGAISPIAHMFKALFASLKALLEGDIGAAIDYLIVAVKNAIHALTAFFKAQFGLLVDIAKAALGSIFGGLVDWVKGVISDAASIPVVSSFIPDSLLEWAGQEAKPEEKPQPGIAAASERGGGPRMMPPAEPEQERVGPRSRRGDFDYQFEDEEDSGPVALSQMMQRAAAVIPGAEGATADAVSPAANVSNQQTDISNNMTINGITINTQATDAQGVAAGLQGAISGQMGGIFAAEGGVRR